MPDPITNQSGSQSGQSQAQQQAGQQQQQVKPIDSFIQKKSIKDINDIPKMYEDTEASLHRSTQKLQNLKQQVEQNSQGQLTVDDEGKLINNPNFQGGYQPQGQQFGGNQGQQFQGNQGQEQVYDPYTGQLLTDPIALQLARMPLGTREVIITNAIIEQREKQQQQSFINEREVLSTNEAKGFEDDVRNIMNQVPLHMRADKKQWQDALYRAKGMKFDQLKSQFHQEGVDNFLNKSGNQNLPGSSGNQQGGVQLTPDQEKAYQWYQENQPHMFKDRQHFLSRYGNKR